MTHEPGIYILVILLHGHVLGPVVGYPSWNACEAKAEFAIARLYKTDNPAKDYVTYDCAKYVGVTD